MRRIGHLAVDRMVAYLSELGRARVARRHDPSELRRRLAEPLPRSPAGLDATLAAFFEQVLPDATRVNHPRFFAYVPGPGSFQGALGAWLAAAANAFTGTWLGGASLAALELVVLDWLRQAMDLPSGYDGLLTSGGSMANLGALAAARTRAARLEGARVYVGEEAHFSLAKAARVLGLPRAAVRRVRVDDHLRMDPDALADAVRTDRDAGLQPLAVCATAGTTSTGALDPLDALADLCAEESLWLHVDAAYGGLLALLPEHRSSLRGLERADSVTLDPHKGLFAPFSCGCLLVRDLDALRRAFAADGAYMQDVPRELANFFERGPELSRPARALPLWMLLRSVGLEAILESLRENLRLCRLAHDLLAADPRVRILTEPSVTVFTFTPRSGESAGRALVERLLEDGHTMLSSTRVRSEFALRLCVLNHRTTESDVRSAVERIQTLLPAT